MLALMISVVFFGLVHPISKVLLDSGVPFSYFCISYIGIRLVVQIPILIIKKEYSIDNIKNLFLILFLGAIGASLQYFEFKAIMVGLSPGTVTFLMFTYPLWISIFKIFKGASSENQFILFFKMITTLGGMLLVSNAAMEEIKSGAVIFPLLAGLSIALWITISNKLRKLGLGSIKVSTYYDMFSLIFMIMYFHETLILDTGSFTKWISLTNGVYLVSFSLIIGLLPNLLFYHGSKSVDSLTSGMVLAFEPIFSTLYSCFLWSMPLTNNFLVGALLIFFANIPSQLFKNFKTGKV